MNTNTITQYRLDQVLIYQFLLVAALLLLAAPLATKTSGLGMLWMFSLQIILTSIATLAAIIIKQPINRISVTVLFGIWLLVWITHLM
ncbi:hypothetical protein [Shewanella algidipiscicola]|uniref:Uncharacterized protein n=1 Tax=Shewanella algidipiscicola TaxID=614070 RepID=A0ABQ4PP71_9GAMM|nr:hypothetical protein [Shewanella algidipiscicola]GIU50083.1 hypothetical protein TUM4630_30210 [Shewanella algidipiscicola]